MDNEQPKMENDQPSTQKLPLGGGYLKPGHIKPGPGGVPQTVRCQVSRRNGGTRLVPAHGKFQAAVEIPLDFEGIPKILSLPENAKDIQDLKTVFGPFENWGGKTVEVFESSVFEAIRIRPIG